MQLTVLLVHLLSTSDIKFIMCSLYVFLAYLLEFLFGILQGKLMQMDSRFFPPMFSGASNPTVVLMYDEKEDIANMSSRIK